MNLLAVFLVLLSAPMRITRDTTLPPNGQYRQAVLILADNITFDCNGSTFTGDGTGVGILIQGRTGVRVRNCKVHGFDVGMYVVGGKNFVFENNDLSGNYVDDNYPLDLARPVPHGGMILNGIQNSRVQGNTSNGNIAGIQILNSLKMQVLRNTTSRNRGWGIYLYGTTASTIYTNTAEYNNRSCWSGKDSGCEAAGIVLTQQSDRNIVAWNALNYNGDGIYQGSSAGGASNDNEFHSNRIAHSVANGIEATFSFRNYIHHNTFSDDNYGAWLGYTQYTRFENNMVQGSHVKSVQADNARFHKYTGNTFAGSDVLLQPFQGGTCAGNSFGQNTTTGAKIITMGCQ